MQALVALDSPRRSAGGLGAALLIRLRWSAPLRISGLPPKPDPPIAYHEGHGSGRRKEDTSGFFANYALDRLLLRFWFEELFFNPYRVHVWSLAHNVAYIEEHQSRGQSLNRIDTLHYETLANTFLKQSAGVQLCVISDVRWNGFQSDAVSNLHWGFQSKVVISEFSNNHRPVACTRCRSSHRLSPTRATRAYAAKLDAISQYHLTPKFHATLSGTIGHVRRASPQSTGTDETGIRRLIMTQPKLGFPIWSFTSHPLLPETGAPPQ